MSARDAGRREREVFRHWLYERAFTKGDGTSCLQRMEAAWQAAIAYERERVRRQAMAMHPENSVEILDRMVRGG